MRIAFDLDGVLADLETVLGEAAEHMYGRHGDRPSTAPAAATPLEEADDQDAAPEDEPVPPLFHQLGSPEQRRLWRRVLETENFWETLNEIEPGIITRLAVLALERRWEVIFVTQRPSSAGDTCQLQSQRWLATHGFTMPSVFVLRGSRGKLAAALDLDVVVDDRPENCLDVVLESKAKAILVWRGDPAAPAPANAPRLKIDVVQSVAECLDKLADEREERATGFIGRLKRFIAGSPSE
jgi:hypothetical protein